MNMFSTHLLFSLNKFSNVWHIICCTKVLERTFLNVVNVFLRPCPSLQSYIIISFTNLTSRWVLYSFLKYLCSQPQIMAFYRTNSSEEFHMFGYLCIKFIIIYHYRISLSCSRVHTRDTRAKLIDHLWVLRHCGIANILWPF